MTPPSFPRSTSATTYRFGTNERSLLAAALLREAEEDSPDRPISLDAYEILERLGKGGMGEVTKARHRALNRIVALKSLRPELSSDTRFARRFHEEAKTLAALQHPNIVTIFDFGTANDGQMYLVMEYVEGQTLRQVLQAGPCQFERGLHIIRGLCAGVAEAHKNGIVHRDLKPENILLTHDNGVKVVDFGLASSTHQADMRADSLLRQVVGTLKYMAPEQKSETSQCNRQTDVFAIGLILYEVLTGSVPEGAFEPLSTRLRSAKWLDGIVNRCLQPDPQRRFADAGQVLDEMNRHLESSKQKNQHLFSRRYMLIGSAGSMLSLTAAYFSFRALQATEKMLDLLSDKVVKSVSSGSADYRQLPSGNLHLSQTGRAIYTFQVSEPQPMAIQQLHLRCESTVSLSKLEIALQAKGRTWTYRHPKTVTAKKWRVSFSADSFDPPLPKDEPVKVDRVLLAFEPAAPSTSVDMIVSQLSVSSP